MKMSKYERTISIAAVSIISGAENPDEFSLSHVRGDGGPKVRPRENVVKPRQTGGGGERRRIGPNDARGTEAEVERDDDQREPDDWLADVPDEHLRERPLESLHDADSEFHHHREGDAERRDAHHDDGLWRA